MPQTTSVIASRRQSLVGAERLISEPTQTEAPVLAPPPRAAAARAHELGATLNTAARSSPGGEQKINVTLPKRLAVEVDDALIGPVEDDVPIPGEGSCGEVRGAEDFEGRPVAVDQAQERCDHLQPLGQGHRLQVHLGGR